MRVVVLDFDGAMTDAEAEGVPFRRGYLQDLAALTGLTIAEVEALAERAEAEVAADPQSYGWTYGGRIVAPAQVDPYLRIMPVAAKIFDAAGAYPADGDRSRLLQVLFRYNYPKTATVFRTGAREVLAALDRPTTYVVTNSHTDPVCAKILSLMGDGEGIRSWTLGGHVVGDAKKYVVDPSFAAVPEFLTIPGLNRPVLLRRRDYHAVLERILHHHGIGWEDLTVVGDIFELDLALPLAMGARVGLMVNDYTPGYERAFLGYHPRARLLTRLEEIVPFVHGG